MSQQNADDHLVDLLNRVAERPARAADALRELYDLTSAKLYAVALRIVGQRDWAEDVLQDAYLNIWRIAGDYRSAISPPMAWMGMIVRSRALDFLRSRAREHIDANVELNEDLADILSSGEPSPLDNALASEQAWALHQCLSKLDGKQREVLSLAYLRDLSHAELATQLKLPLGTVKTWIRRGLERLRGCMSHLA